MTNSFIEYLEEQKDVLENLIQELKQGHGEKCISIFHIDLERLAFWLNGREEDLTYIEEED